MHMEKEGAEEFLSISTRYDDGHSSPGNASGRFEITANESVGIC